MQQAVGALVDTMAEVEQEMLGSGVHSGRSGHGGGGGSVDDGV